ncbi:DinB family protein [Cytobacillus firmus]|nr:DinB family protein [Cytobacillus firmus]MED1908639.1 DinB family protein [Cytobacillus firmus]MED1942189.1 DinB family protein [Cytobacillus firmus]
MSACPSVKPITPRENIPIMAMARQLGYEPPNTDVLGTRD